MFRTLLLAALIALVCMADPVFAQSTVIDGGSIFGAWKPYITEIVGIFVAAVLGWIVKLLRDKFNIEIEAKHRDAIQTALTNAAGLVINRAEGAVGAIQIDVKNAAIAEAVNYVAKGVPDALAYFKVGPDRLREMIEAKVGVVKAPNA